ncbi:unnamed protein product [Vitrella brassicaformis CCMP3155]|uniref:Interferon-related developmental regulator N-terminal domain-containing protein n=2 Tax=Vitrella brassicaformis TaxID=1169539 RepID=A0A0G4GDE6_VITBC|nr:unnamed protein product [Vitrella brassicaformis CCMP3155]|mmetsp:Transcript_37062/g.92991  ORF Transcript_37062/g.92991 Transcript_37062/m.92991 type:complete len:466 (+) Transcript_37062:103-1500(+)|eukprot:CEM27328.1 unnamed protein product [Vitrella brassicaformis CCMP3155]
MPKGKPKRQRTPQQNDTDYLSDSTYCSERTERTIGAMGGQFEDEEPSEFGFFSKTRDTAAPSDASPPRAEESTTGSAGSFEELLEQLAAKRGSTRIAALDGALKLLRKEYADEVVSGCTETILSRLCGCIKKGDAKEAVLACDVLGVVLITLGSPALSAGQYEYCVGNVQRSYASQRSPQVKSRIATVLALMAFLGCDDDTKVHEMVEWMRARAAHIDLSKTEKEGDSESVQCEGILDGWTLLSSLQPPRDLADITQSPASDLWDLAFRGLHGQSVDLRSTAGSSLALMLEAKWRAEDSDTTLQELEAVRSEEMALLRQLGGSNTQRTRGLTKDELKEQRATFRQILEVAETGSCSPFKFYMGSRRKELQIATWSAICRYELLKSFLQGGMLPHMQDNPVVRALIRMEDVEGADNGFGAPAVFEESHDGFCTDWRKSEKVRYVSRNRQRQTKQANQGAFFGPIDE